MESAKHYFGKVCAKHPELRGERYRCNWVCVRCAAAQSREQNRTPEGLARRRDLKRTLKYSARRRAREIERRRDNPLFKLLTNTRTRIYGALRKGKKSNRTLALLGVPSIEFYKSYLEAQFGPGMTWENAGTTWHIDHRIPLSLLDMTKPEDQRFGFNYKNTRPMPADANRRRGNRLVFEDLL